MSNITPIDLIYEPALASALRQGEIITGLVQYIIDWDNTDIQHDEISYISVKHPYTIVVSQDCDLDWDYQARALGKSSSKILPNILFCEVVTAIDLRGKTEINSGIWSNIKINKNERYQFLQQVTAEEDAYQEGLPELGVDFKRYFTIPTKEAYLQLEREHTKRRCRLKSPYVEHFSSRFYYFQSRIALPSEHFSEPS